MQNSTTTERTCQGLLGLPLLRVKPFVNFSMSLACDTTSDSIVGLSSNKHFYYHYSNMCKVTHLLADNEKDWQKNNKILLHYFYPLTNPTYFVGNQLGNCPLIIGDVSNIKKNYSDCLAERVYIHTANGRGIQIGYKLAFLHLYQKKWALPLKVDVVDISSNANDILVKQVKEIFNKEEGLLKNEFGILVLDSGYGNAKTLCPLYENEKLLTIVRLRAGQKVYPQFTGAQKETGAPKIYGEVYYLSPETVTKSTKYKNKKTKEEKISSKLCVSIMDSTYDEIIETAIEFKNGKKGVLIIYRFNNLLLRSKKENNMKDKPFDLLKVEIWNEDKTSKIFTKEMYLCISGKEKSKLETKEAYHCYRKRFACEVFYRFSKQNLFLEGFQTPDKMHFLNFLSVFFTAWWILWTARNEVSTTCAVWQQYLPENKAVKKTTEENKEENGDKKQALSPSQVQRGLSDFFDTFDNLPFIPLKCKKGKGREKGQKLIKRMKQKVLKKEKKVEKNQKNE